MKYNIAIDADSLLYKSCYRHQLVNKKNGTVYTDKEREDSFNLELAYFEFCQEIGKIRSAPFDGSDPLIKYEKGDDVNVIIALSPPKSFRNEIYPEYKANRKPLDIFGIKQLKKLVVERFGDWIVLKRGVEADEVVNYYAREHGYMVAAIDKDVINANPTPCYNYNQFKWNQPKSQMHIEQWYLIQALMGDSTDNIKGASGVGKVGAEKAVLENPGCTIYDIEHLFRDRAEALMNYWLVRMDQWDGEKITLWGSEDGTTQ